MKTAIIDVDGLMFVIGNGNKVLDKYGNPKRTEDGKRFIYTDKTEDELIVSADTLMNNVLINGKFDSYIGFIKGVNTTNIRLKVNPDYKSNRNTEPPKWWNICSDYLVNKWKINYSHDRETDDACRITQLNTPNSHLVSADKDILMLEGENFNWSTNKWITVTKEEAAYNFWKSVIVGDAADFIKGIPGIGAQNEIFTKSIFKPTADYVLSFYIHKLGEKIGISEFYKNWHSLRILDEAKDFIIPEINIYNKIIDVKEEEW